MFGAMLIAAVVVCCEIMKAVLVKVLEVVVVG